MTTTPNAIKRLSREERKDAVRLLKAVEEETGGEISSGELKELLVGDNDLLRNTESIKVPDDAPGPEERSIPEGDEVVM